MSSKSALPVSMGKPQSTNDNNDKAREQLRWRQDAEKENSSPPKSYGISPSNFHRKRRDRKTAAADESWKETLETNLFIQEKEQHKQKLEDRRKAFKQITTLKTWPLQDMAIEHLKHLLSGKENAKFHGGDYLSLESSSSISSAENSKRQQLSSSPLRKTKNKYQEYWKEFQRNQTEPLWSQEPRIFATEKAQGKRKYLVGQFGRVADWYWRKANPKHLYEVIRENTPCRLYFDLEYSKIYNTDVDEVKLLEEFRLELETEFKTSFDISFEASQLIDLDSSTDAKFSRHWILDLKDCLFEDASTVGRFVKRMVGRLAEDLATDQLRQRRPTLAKYLFVNTKEAGKTSCFIDLGVYTRNRLFRVFKSSKFGKTATLEVSKTNRFPIELPPTQPPAPKATLEEYIIGNNWEPHARVLADTLVVPLGGSNNHRILKVEGNDSGLSRGGGTTNSSSSNRVIHPLISMRTSTTPLPSLDKYVSEVLATRGGTKGNIRAWSIEYGPRETPISITYQLSRNRYCELIGREHKSNNVFWTIIFGSWTCIQGCHDPECFGRGTPIAIPDEYLIPLKEELHAWQEKEFEKALLGLNLDDSDQAATITTSRNNRGSETSESNPSLSAGEEQKQESKGAAVGYSATTSLSDEALIFAVLSNPELFP